MILQTRRVFKSAHPLRGHQDSSVTTPHALCKTEGAYRKFGRDMSLAAEAAVPYGIKVGIHTTYNHFRVKFDGVTAWDTIFAEASPLLQQQVDTSNAFNVIGDGLLPLLKKYSGRSGWSRTLLRYI